MLVNTSEKEGWGLTVMEASACGTPTIASDVPGLRDSVLDGETGLLVPHGNQQTLVDALLRVLRNSDLRERMSRSCVDWASRFTWEAAATDIEALVEAVAEGRDCRAVPLKAWPGSGV